MRALASGESTALTFGTDGALLAHKEFSSGLRSICRDRHIILIPGQFDSSPLTIIQFVRRDFSASIESGGTRQVSILSLQTGHPDSSEPVALADADAVLASRWGLTMRRRFGACLRLRVPPALRLPDADGAHLRR